MIEEPFRWIEAIANRREYIETQLATGSPLVALGCAEGILLASAGQTQQKLFEVYDRIALGAIGHPGDIERLRMTAIELASTEGFTRSAADVSLRRLSYFSLSPLMKTAFEQIYGAPFLARLLFAELGGHAGEDLFLKLDFDGSITARGGGKSNERYACIAGTRAAEQKMEARLREEHQAEASLNEALRLARELLRSVATDEQSGLSQNRLEETSSKQLEAALLERGSRTAISYRVLSAEEIASADGA